MTTHDYIDADSIRHPELERLDTELDALMTEASDLTRDGDLTGDAAQRFEEIENRVAAVRKERDTTREQVDRIKRAVRAGNYESGDGARVDRGRPRDEDDYTRGQRNISDANRAGDLPDYAAERATTLLEQGSSTDRSLAARWAATAGSEHYRGAFAKLLADPERGHLLWTPEEADSYRQVAAVNVELQRAMSTTGTAGGHMIPLTLDPAIMLTNDGSNNPLRQLARVVQTATNTWQGVTSAGATAEWKTEAAQVADGSPTLGNPSIPMFFGDSFVPYSFEVGMDAHNFLTELAAVLVDSADNLMATAYTTGNGTTAPQGIVTGLAGTASELDTTGTEALHASDPYKLQNALPARFSANAVFMSHIATANTYRQMETTNGAHEFPELRDNPPRLIGKPWYENSNMDGAIDAAATANNYALLYGDVAKGFIIADRIGSTMELVPHIMGANDRPTGQRGALLWFRTGSKVVVPQALRLLDVPTTA